MQQTALIPGREREFAYSEGYPRANWIPLTSRTESAANLLREDDDEFQEILGMMLNSEFDQDVVLPDTISLEMVFPTSISASLPASPAPFPLAPPASPASFAASP